MVVMFRLATTTLVITAVVIVRHGPGSGMP
jgi:hypothetical protein